MTDSTQNQPNFQDGFIVRDKRKQSRFYVDNEFINDGYEAFLGRRAAVYYCLLKHANAETQKCFPSYETIMRDTGIKNRNEIVGALNALAYLQLIAIKKSPSNRANMYYMLKHTQWLPLSSITIDTAKAVSKMTRKQYQKQAESSISADTLNQRRNSTDNIKDNKIMVSGGVNDREIARTPEEQDKVIKAMAEMRKNLSEKLGLNKK